MPREMARQSVWTETKPSSLNIQIRQVDRTVWVTLSGILDQPGMQQLVARVAPVLAETGCRVILDGERLTHLDYRVTRSLLRWHRNLKLFGHQLFLRRWSEYLQAILIMEDWSGELTGNLATGLSGNPDSISQWRVLDGLLSGRRS